MHHSARGKHEPHGSFGVDSPQRHRGSPHSSDLSLARPGSRQERTLIPRAWNVLKNSSDVTSSSGVHGTYVAGAVALALGNDVGNAGYCPGCRIMPVQVGTDSGPYLSDLASGLTWAADHGARVANMSWAGPSSSSTLTNAVSYARSKGMVVTAAAGNSNCDCPTYPAATPGVIGVAGTSNTDTGSTSPHPRAT
jgi:Subtilase family